MLKDRLLVGFIGRTGKEVNNISCLTVNELVMFGAFFHKDNFESLSYYL
jgi:hypothetical protein